MTVRMRCILFLMVAAGFAGGLIRLGAHAPQPNLPAGNASAPLVVYHHGSRIGFDKLERPFPWLAHAGS